LSTDLRGIDLADTGSLLVELRTAPQPTEVARARIFTTAIQFALLGVVVAHRRDIVAKTIAALGYSAKSSGINITASKTAANTFTDVVIVDTASSTIAIQRAAEGGSLAGIGTRSGAGESAGIISAVTRCSAKTGSARIGCDARASLVNTNRSGTGSSTCAIGTTLSPTRIVVGREATAATARTI